MNSSNLGHNPSQIIESSESITFYLGNKPVQAHKGDTIASALYKAGIRIFSRSFKYHRPRGLLCVNGRCPNCLMAVDDVPNVRTCMQQVEEGMRVEHQNAWPSLNHDVMSVLDKMDRLMPVGFYYKSFVKPKFLWQIAEPIIRRVAGLGRLDTNKSYERYEHYNQHTNVAVVGGGPAGIAAAIQAAKTGVHVTLIDDQQSLGGHLRADTQVYQNVFGYPNGKGYEVARNLTEAAMALPNLDVFIRSNAFGLYDGNLLGVIQGKRLIKLRSKSIVVASGCHEVPLVFHGNDLPGVMLSTGLKRLINLYGVKPGTKAVVVTSNDQGYAAAKEMLAAGIKIAAIADSRPASQEDTNIIRELRSQDVPILTSYTIKEARGSKQVRHATLVSLKDGQELRLRCDLVCLAPGFDPFASLLYQAGSRSAYDDTLNETVPSQLPPSIYAAGEVSGIHDVQISILQGKIAGLEASYDLLDPAKKGAATKELKKYKSELEEMEAQYRANLRVGHQLIVPGSAKKKFVCFCEDVTEKDLKDGIAEGFDDMQTLKRYSTLSMGPCQGKMCLKGSSVICAEQTNRSIQETGSTTSRPPVQPISMSALAGPSHMPIKLTPLDRKHREIGANMMDVGPWKRPFAYGSAQDECLAVRQRVGIIDVSTLGKLDVQGTDAPALLDLVYTHKFSNLRVGRIRYGILCSDNGMIIDDGTVTRLADDHYFVTTTTGNIDLMEEWLKWWSVGNQMCVHIANVTAAYAAINVAGPRAREVLSKLTDIDLSTEGFRYMRSANGDVAGVPSILLRIGFVGETGWEVHFPSEYAEYMWDTFMETGKQYGIAPFGVEAQRILRLQKKHIIVGQDTDIVSNPLEGDLSWAVRFDKEVDFIGRHALQVIQERGMQDKLVGFVIENEIVPEDGVAVVANGKPIGRVTSSRLSPTTGRGFGLAWVPVDLAKDGNRIYIQVKDRPVPARVSDPPEYDPEGERLRS